jgi:hypothetical protein
MVEAHLARGAGRGQFGNGHGAAANGLDAGRRRPLAFSISLSRPRRSGTLLRPRGINRCGLEHLALDDERGYVPDHECDPISRVEVPVVCISRREYVGLPEMSACTLTRTRSPFFTDVAAFNLT